MPVGILFETPSKKAPVTIFSCDSRGKPSHKLRLFLAMPLIMFKKHNTGGVGGVFQKMFHFFCYQREEFLAHYHKRSNVESTVMMIKTKFGDAVRSKSDVAACNEVLCKVLCHNICCLISAMYELGIQATF